MPSGERHGLGVAMLADILAQEGYEVRNLGTDTPAPSLVAAIADTDRLAAVVISVVDVGRRPAAKRLLAAARHERPSVPLVAGGYAVPDARSAIDLGADGWAADPRDLAALIERLGIKVDGVARCRDGGRRSPT
jgi:MerR family transcriptional regulator, light-induced transcriptional regulator